MFQIYIILYANSPSRHDFNSFTSANAFLVSSSSFLTSYTSTFTHYLLYSFLTLSLVRPSQTVKCPGTKWLMHFVVAKHLNALLEVSETLLELCNIIEYIYSI